MDGVVVSAFPFPSAAAADAGRENEGVLIACSAMRPEMRAGALLHSALEARPGFRPGARMPPTAPLIDATHNDEALMLRFQEDGDAQAFETLFARHKDAFVTFLWRLAGSQAVAEDISQHCWLRIVELARRRGYRPDSGASFRTFLYTLGRNRYIDACCRSHRATRTQSFSDEDDARAGAQAGDPAAAAFETGERAALLTRALAALPPEQREVIALWAGDFTIEQMVRMTGAPRDTVLSRKKYALARLRKALAAMGVEA